MPVIPNTVLTSGACTGNTVMDALKPYVYIPVHFLLAREHCTHFSSASLFSVNVVLDRMGSSTFIAPSVEGGSRRNQRKRVLGKPGPCPQGMSCSFLFPYCFTALL